MDSSREEMARELEALRQRVTELEALNTRSKKLGNIKILSCK